MSTEKNGTEGRTVTPNGEELVRRRKERGWNQTVMAEKAGCSVGSVKRHEKGEPLLLETLRGYARAFGLADDCTPLIQQDAPPASPVQPPKVRVLITEHSSNRLHLKIECDLILDTDSPQDTPVHMAVYDFLHRILPDKKDIGIVGLAFGVVIISVERSEANVEALGRLAGGEYTGWPFESLPRVERVVPRTETVGRPFSGVITSGGMKSGGFLDE